MKEEQVTEEFEVVEKLDDEEIPANDVRNMFGFGMAQTVGLMASLASIGLAVFGTVFYLITR